MSRQNQQKINILFIIDYLHEQGGTERHLLYLLRLLDKTVYRCFVVAFDTGKTDLTDNIRREGIAIEHIPVGRYYTLDALRKSFRLASYIKENNIDIVQTFHFKADFYGALIARFSGVNHLISSKRDNADHKKQIQFFLNSCVKSIISRYIAVSSEVKKVVQLKEKVHPDLIEVIYNGVDLTAFSPPEMREKKDAKLALGLEENDFILGSVAWFRPEKDHKTLLKAFIAARKSIPNLKLVLVGGGPLFSEYKDYIQNQGLDHTVILTGPVNDVRPYLRAFDLACLVPSCKEGFSNSIIEKMASGLPLIVTDIGGNAEAVLNGVNGFVIRPGDYKALENSIITLHNDTNLLKGMTENSVQRVRKEFSIEQMIARHEHLYSSMMQAAVHK